MTRRYRGRVLPTGVYVTQCRRGRSTTFRGRFVGHDGRRRSGSFDTLDDAAGFVELGRAQARRIRAGLEPAPRAPTPTLAELAEQVLRRPPANWTPGHRQDVRKRLELHVLDRLGPRRVDDITRGDVLELRDDLRRPPPDGSGLAEATTNKVISALSVVLQRARDHELLTSNPARGRGIRLQEPEREPRTLTADEALAFIEASDEAYRALFATAILAGARWGELVAAVWGDIDLQRQRWIARRSNTRDRTKNGSERVVILPDSLMPFLDDMIQRLYGNQAPPADYLVFRRADRHRNRRKDRTGRHPWCLYSCARTARLSDGGATKAIADAASAAGIVDPPTFHGLRHSHVSIALDRGVPPPTVQRQVGHKCLSTTTRYARAQGSERMQALTLTPGVDLSALRVALDAGDIHRAQRLLGAP